MVSGILGNRAVYKKLAAGVSLYAVGSVYLLFAVVQYYWRNETWVFEPMALAAAACCAAGFSLFAYFCFLLLDAQIFAPREQAQDEKKQLIPLP